MQPLAYPLVWNGAQKALFRFFAVYFALYVTSPPGTDELTVWTARTVFDHPITVWPNGSGDTTYNYVQVFVYLVLATATLLVWSVLDRRRAHYNRLLYWLVVGLRYYVAFTMFGYGFAKIFKTQFPFPSLARLLETYGQSSPMGLAWTFMGYSTAYNYFTGLGEVVGGALLLFRRTTALGCVVLLCVIGNIVAINFCFDVPVKLYSSHLLLMTVFILAAEGRRLINVLLLNRPAPPLDLTPALPNRRWRTAGYVLKAGVIGFVLYNNVVNGFSSMQQYGDKAPKPALYGLYTVEEFRLNGQLRPPLLTDTTRWRQVIVSGYHHFTMFHVRLMTDSLRGYTLRLDSARRQLVVQPRFDTTQKTVFHYVRADTNALELRGRWRQDSLYARLRRQPVEQLLLVNRGFHWINEYPFNR